MKKTILSILIILLMASNALAYCGAFTTDAAVLGVAPSLEDYSDTSEEETGIATYASETTALGLAWTAENIGEPECTQTLTGQSIGDFNGKYQIMFDSPIPDYQKTFFDTNTNVITTVAAFNGVSGSVSVVSIDFDTDMIMFKKNYAWNGDAITFTGATYDMDTGHTTISANTQDEGLDVQIIFTINNVGAEVYTTQIGIGENNMKSGCIEYVNGVLVTCTQVDGYSGVTTINPDTGAAISTVVIPITVNPPTPQPYDTIDDEFAMPHADPAFATQNVYNFGIASNGAITPTAYKYTSLTATWESVNGIEILSESTTAVTGMTTTGLSTYPTLSVYNTLTNAQIFGYQIENENAVIAGVAVTEDGDIAVAATDTLLQETSVYLFDSTGVLLNSGKMPDFSAYTIDVFTVQSGGTVTMIAGKNIANKPTIVQIDLETFDAAATAQNIDADIRETYIDPDGNGMVYSLRGSFGIQIYGITANPDVPEFSITTLLLATLLAGGLVLFVVRRRK